MSPFWACPASSHDGQDEGGGVGSVVVDGLLGDGQGGAAGQGRAAAQVAAPAGMGATGYQEPQAVALAEVVGGGPQVDLEAQTAVGLGLAAAGRDAAGS